MSEHCHQQSWTIAPPATAAALAPPLPEKLVLQLVPKDAATRTFVTSAGLNCNVELSVK